MTLPELPQTPTICAARSQVLVIDVQARLSPAMAAGNTVVSRSALLLKIGETLNVPVIFSEQYRKGLGKTEAELRAAAPSGQVFEKMEFSCARNPAISAAIGSMTKDGRSQVVICGIEAHVCVAQSALDLAAAGNQVFVVADAVASRRDSDKAMALDRFRDCGIGVVSSEMVAFEWLERAGTPDFKAISALLKPL